MELLWREGAALGDYRFAILSVEICAFDGSLIQIRNAHVGPEDVTMFNVDDNAIGRVR